METVSFQHLVSLHSEIERSIDALELLTSEPVPRLGEVSAARYRLARASRARTSLLNKHLYRAAEARAQPPERLAVAALQLQAAQLLACSTRHIGHWTVDEIKARWAEYCPAAHEMLSDMRRRVAVERATLYPLLDSDARSAAA